MRFGKTLRSSLYEPWKSNYIDYAKLKKLLRDDGSTEADSKDTDLWTEEDESAFCEELMNVQLEKVNTFQVETYKKLRERTSECEHRLEKFTTTGEENGNQKVQDEDAAGHKRREELSEVLERVDAITMEINELEKYSRINFTGFLKAAKKHDRRRGSNYRVRPLLQVRLAALPFNSEDYSPLLYRLSAMYSFIRQNLEADGERTQSLTGSKSGGEKYKSHKFWVHPENLLEVKTYILRRLPVLVYNPQTSKLVDRVNPDPTITSLYFDNPKFALYTQKVERTVNASSLRLRWSGHLDDKPEIYLEKKTIKEDDNSEEIKFPIKEKYILPFINGEYKLEKSIQKLQDREGAESDGAKTLESSVGDIQDFITENELQPILRANYRRTAFQIPGDDGIRISLDTDLALIREDSLDTDRPCRDPEDWHRRDIDDSEIEFPFTKIRKGEISRFPYALLEIKMKDSTSKRTSEWVAEFMSSHLVKEAPRFSKFVHGIAQLFEDYVNSFPFWLSDLETDIRKDPEVAFQEEQDKKAKTAEDESAVGSLLGHKLTPSYKAAVGSPIGKSSIPTKYQIGDDDELESKSAGARGSKQGVDDIAEEDDSDDDGQHISQGNASSVAGIRSLLPSLSTSKYARARRQRSFQLPPGVEEPGKLIKDSGPVRVEPKVWLANQRTFIKWQHITVLLASLSLGLYNAAGQSNSVARGLAIVYTLVAAFSGVWGWWMFIVRSRMIERRSGKDFDNVVGPIIVCFGLVIALCVNFGFKYHSALDYPEKSSVWNVTIDPLWVLLALGASLRFYCECELASVLDNHYLFGIVIDVKDHSESDRVKMEENHPKMIEDHTVRDEDDSEMEERDSSEEYCESLDFKSRWKKLASSSSSINSPVLSSSSGSCLDRSAYSSESPPSLPKSVRFSEDSLEVQICKGAATFKGFAYGSYEDTYSTRQFRAFVNSGEPQQSGFNGSVHEMTTWMSLSLNDALGIEYTRDHVEQPSMHSAFGALPGTMSLNFWVDLNAKMSTSYSIPQEGIDGKVMDVRGIFTRMDYLQRNGLEYDCYNIVYKYLVYKASQNMEKQQDIEEQIVDLITVLEQDYWIDFSEVENQMLSRFFCALEQKRQHTFFHQLLLSMELYLRLQRQRELHLETASQKSYPKLSPKVAWDLALAERWMQNVAIVGQSGSASFGTGYAFEYLNRKRQIQLLKEFAFMLEWPNMLEVTRVLEEGGNLDYYLEQSSGSMMAWLSGVVLPGTSLPYLMMKALIACDHAVSERLACLTNLAPASGFQYKARTYWSFQCIVGKVMGAAQRTKQVAGWVGPCSYSLDLSPIQCIRVHQEKSPAPRLTRRDVRSMAEHSHPLGPKGAERRMEDYKCMFANINEEFDSISVEGLAFRRVPASRKITQATANDSSILLPPLYTATVIFNIKNKLYPIHLRYDVTFIAAASCYGLHGIHKSYVHESIEADELPSIRKWGRFRVTDDDDEDEVVFQGGCSAREDQKKVLVVNCCVAKESEVFARAWAANVGMSCVVANMKKTCPACAVREAYAACVRMVILSVGYPEDEAGFEIGF